MQIGLKARFSDFNEIIKLKPDFVEFHFSDVDPDYNFVAAEKYPFPCFIHLPEMWNGHMLDISSIKNENQVVPLNESIEVLQKIITKSERFFNYFSNTENVFILHPGGMSFEKDYPENNKNRIDTLIDSLSQIKTNNSEILVENLPPFPWYLGGQWNSNIFMDAKEIEKFCIATGRKICFDTSHSKLYCNSVKKDFISEFSILKKYIKHIHIGDAKGVDGEGIQIDEGEIDFKKFFELLKDYPGTIVNEIWMGYTNDFQGFKIANQKIKKYLSQ